MDLTISQFVNDLIWVLYNAGIGFAVVCAFIAFCLLVAWAPFHFIADVFGPRIKLHVFLIIDEYHSMRHRLKKRIEERRDFADEIRDDIDNIRTTKTRTITDAVDQQHVIAEVVAA